MLNPKEQAKASEYYSKNYQGKILCTLCLAACADEDKFLVHLEASKHQKRLKQLAINKARSEKIREEEKAGWGQKKMMNAAQLQQCWRPQYSHRTEYDPQRNKTKVWIDVVYRNVSEDSRPLHRWLNTHEQQQEPHDQGVVYLLIACEQYETVGFKFPSKLPRPSTSEAESGVYDCQWDPLKKIYSLFFVLG